MKNVLIVVLVVLVSYLTWAFRGAIYADETTSGTNSAVLRVKVVNETGESATSATVNVRSEDGEFAVTSTEADNTGSYIFKVNSEISYDVVATVEGKVASQSVTLTPSQVLLLTLTPIAR